MKDDHSTVLVVGGGLITLELDVSGQETDLSTHLDEVVTEVLDSSVMLVEQGLFEGDHWLRVSV